MSVGTSVVSIFNGHGHQGFAQGKWPKPWVPESNGPSDVTCELKLSPKRRRLGKRRYPLGLSARKRFGA